jgi:hypothetical protein
MSVKDIYILKLAKFIKIIFYNQIINVNQWVVDKAKSLGFRGSKMTMRLNG